jgi:hypothetical protein
MAYIDGFQCSSEQMQILRQNKKNYKNHIVIISYCRNLQVSVKLFDTWQDR